MVYTSSLSLTSLLPASSAIGDALYVAAPATPAVIAGTNIIYEEPDGGRAAVVGEDSTTQQWLAEVVIGGQSFQLTVDTGSSDLWVYGSNFTTAPGVGNTSAIHHSIYECISGSSSNCEHEGTFNISYVLGFGASGNVVYDTVNISNLIVPQMAVEVADVVGPYSQQLPDGILGLSFPSLNRALPQQPTFMERLMPRLPAPLFTVDFIPQEGGNLAQIEFGYINSRKANGNLHTAPVNNANGFWQVDDINFIVGDPGYGSLIPLNQSMIFDTGGSTRISLDPRILAYYYSEVGGSALINNSDGSISYSYPCTETLPDLTLNIGNGTAIYRSSLLNTTVIDPAKGLCSGPLGSQSHAEGVPGNMGADFFAYHFVVFNQGVPEISYAPWLPFNGSSGNPGTPGSKARRNLFDRTTIPGERWEIDLE